MADDDVSNLLLPSTSMNVSATAIDPALRVRVGGDFSVKYPSLVSGNMDEELFAEEEYDVDPYTDEGGHVHKEVDHGKIYVNWRCADLIVDLDSVWQRAQNLFGLGTKKGGLSTTGPGMMSSRQLEPAELPKEWTSLNTSTPIH